MTRQVTAEVLSTETAALFAAAVHRAVELLRAGQVVALPTETVYGLAANALDAKAVAEIYEIKGRPAHNPIIVHVADVAMAQRCVTNWPTSASQFAKSFWPGPLTMVLPRAKVIPNIVTAGGATVGVRLPSHPFMQAVIRACGFPLAAPSANLSNSISPTNAEHVRKQLGDKIALIVNGGQSQVGIESTVIDLTTEPPRVLRPGMIHEESLRAALADYELQVDRREKNSDEVGLRSPGLLQKHYSPKAKLRLLDWKSDPELRQKIGKWQAAVGHTQIIAHTHIPSSGEWGGVSVIPRDAEAFARAIYAELHRCEEAGAQLIVVEALPEGTEWRAIADRLTRASAD